MEDHPRYLQAVPTDADADAAAAPVQAPENQIPGEAAAPVQTPDSQTPAAPAAPVEPPENQIPGLTPPTQRGNSRLIWDIVVDLGYATRERVDEAINEARVSGRVAEEVMLEHAVISADQLARAVADRYGLDHVDLSAYQVDMGAANMLSVSAARRYRAVPIGYVDAGTLLVAMADPANVLAVDDIQMLTGLAVRVAVAAEEDTEALISRLNRFESAVSEAVDEDEDESEDPAEDAGMRESAQDAPVTKLVYTILGQATNEGASDIHFEPGEGEMRVRYRVDGVLSEVAHVPKRMTSGVISRIKIMSELDIAEKRLPQDGRVSVTVEDRRVDLRVTTLPTQGGEGCTIRILDKEKALLSLDELGMDGRGRERFTRSVGQPYGAVFVTGPTGSGKSTTLYAALDELNSVERKIVTIEDPVEYQLDGVNQIQVHRKAGLDFATGLRSMLRADPDVIMVGEIRDGETARIAIEAALTGHMVLSTLHTNDAPGAIVRLQKMGIESFLTTSALDCVVAQRLARQLCSHCKRPVVLAKGVLEVARFRVDADVEAYEAGGCGRCNQSGYRGRIGLFSVMKMSEGIKDLTIRGAPEADIAALAREEGMLTLREDGLLKVRSGVTSIEEVARVSS